MNLEIANLAEAFKKILPESQVSINATVREQHSRDES